ncbi:MAG: PepSY domain-containing protein [Nanoarchaeota archaeon]|nr:PepSY domain-containing protein [Nanoarchaeota archaeon]
MKGMLVSFALLVLFSGLAFAQDNLDDASYKAYFNTEIDKSVKEKRILAEEQIIRNLEDGAKIREEMKKNESNIIERKIMISNSVKAGSQLNLTVKGNGNASKIGVYLSDGRFVEVKYLPDQASAIALKKVNKGLSGLESFIELKEININKEERVVYEIDANKEIKILGIFDGDLKVKAYVDAETGELVMLEKPWWTSLAN